MRDGARPDKGQRCAVRERWVQRPFRDRGLAADEADDQDLATVLGGALRVLRELRHRRGILLIEAGSSPSVVHSGSHILQESRRCMRRAIALGQEFSHYRSRHG